MHPKTRDKLILHHRRLGRRPADLLPDLLDGPDQLQDRGRGDRDAAAAVLRADARELRRRSASAPTTFTSRSTASSSRSAPPCSRSLIAVPAAYAMAFFPGKRTKDMLLWMLSTKMMPAVGVLVPIYLLFRRHRRCSTRAGA